MALPMWDARVRGGDRDPLLLETTPGCIYRFSPLRIATPAADTKVIVASSESSRRSQARIPPVWLTGAANAYVSKIQLSSAVSTQLALAENIADPTDGLSTNVGVIADFVTNAGLAVFDDQGNAAYATLADMAAADTVAGEPWGNTGGIATTGFAGLGTTTAEWVAVLVDRSHPNVDWANLQFLEALAGAGFNAGTDRGLRALTNGTRRWVLHSAAPPTAANRVTGADYQDVVVTGPADFQLTTINGRRFVQNAGDVRFASQAATNIWSESMFIALWDGPVTTGNWLWYGNILSFTARIGAEPVIPAGRGRIELELV